MTSAAEVHYAERVRQLLNAPVTRLRVAGAQWPVFIASLPLDNTPGKE